MPKKAGLDERTKKNRTKKTFSTLLKIMCKTIPRKPNIQMEKQLEIGTFADIRNIWKTTKRTTEN